MKRGPLQLLVMELDPLGFGVVFEPTGTFVEGRMGSGKSQPIVEVNIKTRVKTAKPKRRWQMDGVPKHTSKSSTDHLKSGQLKVLPGSPWTATVSWTQHG